MMSLVFIAYAFQNNPNNIEKTKQYCLLAIKNKHVPFSPALHYPRFLNDFDIKERITGINCGLEILKRCDELWVCGDEVTSGVQQEIDLAKLYGIRMIRIRQVSLIR